MESYIMSMMMNNGQCHYQDQKRDVQKTHLIHNGSDWFHASKYPPRETDVKVICHYTQRLGHCF